MTIRASVKERKGSPLSRTVWFAVPTSADCLYMPVLKVKSKLLDAAPMNPGFGGKNGKKAPMAGPIERYIDGGNQA